VLYGIRYSKALQNILNTEGGKLARDMVQLSTPAFAAKVEALTRRKGRWSKSSLGPQDAAIASIALFGMELARQGQTQNERLAGSTLQMALIDYAKANPSAQAACTAVLTKWVEIRPASSQPAASSPPACSAHQAVRDIDGAWLQEMAKSAASFMAMQARWIQTMTDRPDFNGPTAAAFAYGVWDSVTQQVKLDDDAFLDSLILFASRWLDTDDEKTIDETINAMLCFGDDAAYHQSVVAGGRAFRAWLNGPKGDFFPVHLGQCMVLVAGKFKAR
jgi:hypothetical protein